MHHLHRANTDQHGATHIRHQHRCWKEIVGGNTTEHFTTFWDPENGVTERHCSSHSVQSFIEFILIRNKIPCLLDLLAFVCSLLPPLALLGDKQRHAHF